MFGWLKGRRRDRTQGIEVIHHTKQADAWRDGRWLVVNARLSMRSVKDREQAARLAAVLLAAASVAEPEPEPAQLALDHREASPRDIDNLA